MPIKKYLNDSEIKEYEYIYSYTEYENIQCALGYIINFSKNFPDYVIKKSNPAENKRAIRFWLNGSRVFSIRVNKEYLVFHFNRPTETHINLDIDFLKKKMRAKCPGSEVTIPIYSIHDAALVSNIAFSDSYEDQIKRLKKLDQAEKVPKSKQIMTTVFERNTDVVTEALLLSNGICFDCNSDAPFVRKSDMTPYLEVHHVVPLSEGGLDALENVVALCPNCHKKRHFG